MPHIEVAELTLVSSLLTSQAQNHGMAWLARDLKDDPVPSLPWAGTASIDQGAPTWP